MRALARHELISSLPHNSGKMSSHWASSRGTSDLQHWLAFVLPWFSVKQRHERWMLSGYKTFWKSSVRSIMWDGALVLTVCTCLDSPQATKSGPCDICETKGTSCHTALSNQRIHAYSIKLSFGKFQNINYCFGLLLLNNKICVDTSM